MRIVIPLANGRVSTHLGQSDQVALVDADVSSQQILGTQLLSAPAHRRGMLPQWLHEKGAEVVIARGIGTRAQQYFAKNGITVVVGAPTDEPETLASAYLGGTLNTSGNVCDHSRQRRSRGTRPCRKEEEAQ
jgi:predicted Fe-Mo cluster-binding NifX family protein